MRTTLLLAFTVVLGCTAEAPSDDLASTLPSSFFLKATPANAKPLIEVKASAKAGDEVAFKCRIGGRAEPFVDGRAIMVVIDPSLPSCADNPGDSCPKPWDYCCETQETLVASTATVQLVDGKGNPLKSSLKDNSGLSVLAWITVVGKVAENAEGRFVVNATGVFVEKQG